MNEPFDKHFKSNASVWRTFAQKGFVNTEDLVKARNYDDKYSYAEQNQAINRLNDALSEVLKRNPNNPQLNQFISSMTEASDEMIKDKITSSFRDLDKVTDTDITLKAKKLGIPVDEFRSQFKLVKNRIDEEKGRERRAKEVEEMKWYDPQNWATSDYEKQRYINDPDASIIGKEGNGKWFNKGEAISDLAYGVAGGVADLLPGVGGTVVGPVIRGARDVQHKVTDSKYQKDGGDIAGDFGKDLFVNVGSDVLPTALTRYLPRLVRNAKKAKDGGFVDLLADADNYNLVLDQTKEMGKDLKRFGWDEQLDNIDKFNSLSEKDLKRNFERIKSPELKSAIVENGGVTLNNKGVVTDVNKDKTGEVIMDFWASNKPGQISENWNDFLMPNGKISNEYRTIMNSPSGPYIDKLMKADDISKGSKKFAKAERVWENYGDRVNKTLATMGVGKNIPMLPTAVQSRQTSKVNTDDREDIDWFKTNYARDWEAGFVPRGKEDEPIMKAYREWKEENKKPSVRNVLGGV